MVRLEREEGVKTKGKEKERREGEGGRGRGEHGEREKERKREREEERATRTDNASGGGPFIYLSYVTQTIVLPAQPAMIKYLQHEENKRRTACTVLEEGWLRVPSYDASAS